MKPVFIIAEAGINHNGSMQLAKKLIDSAVEAKADAVKFQTFVAEEIITTSAMKARYQIENTGTNESQLEMAKRLELSRNDHVGLMHYCQKRGIIFLSTAFDLPSAALLHELGMQTFKIASGEITNIPLLRKIGSFGDEIILSSGMASLCEIENALDILQQAGTPKSQITLLHCNTQYPTPFGHVNLNAMVSLKHTFGIRTGYSDHTQGFEIPVAAVALGATVIEKHFTTDKSLAGPDHSSSLTPAELKKMVDAIRHIEVALGDGIKKVSVSERENKQASRKSIVARTVIEKGEILTEQNITTKRPEKGIPASQWDTVVGTKAKQRFEPDDFIVI